MPTRPRSLFSTRTALAILAAAALFNAVSAIGQGNVPPKPPGGGVPTPEQVESAIQAAKAAASISISSVRFPNGGTTIYTNSQNVLFVRGANVGKPNVSVTGTGMSSSAPRPDLDPSCAPPGCAAFNVQTQSSTGRRDFTLRAQSGMTASSSYTVVAPIATTQGAVSGAGMGSNQPKGAMK